MGMGKHVALALPYFSIASLPRRGGRRAPFTEIYSQSDVTASSFSSVALSLHHKQLGVTGYGLCQRACDALDEY